jgi:hypothetical protein
LQAYLDLQRDVDVRSVLPAIQAPTLLIHGTEAIPTGSSELGTWPSGYPERGSSSCPVLR